MKHLRSTPNLLTISMIFGVAAASNNLQAGDLADRFESKRYSDNISITLAQGVGGALEAIGGVALSAATIADIKQIASSNISKTQKFRVLPKRVLIGVVAAHLVVDGASRVYLISDEKRPTILPLAGVYGWVLDDDEGLLDAIEDQLDAIANSMDAETE